MQKIKCLMMMLAAFVVLMSCSKNDDSIIGDWLPLFFDNQNIEVPSEGGDYVSKIKNYYSEFFIYKVEAIQGDNAVTVYDAKNSAFVSSVKSEWFNIGVSNEDKKVIEIHIEPNTAGMDRKLQIVLSPSITGRVTASVNVTQSGK